MKYLKTFESISFKKYIIATMPVWGGLTYIFKTLKYDDKIYYYSAYFTFDEDDNIIKGVLTNSFNHNYEIKMLDILYQTDDLDDAKNMLGTIYNSKIYNL